MKNDKQTRLDQFELKELFGIWPDYQLMKRARRASKALFKFDIICAGSSWRDVDHGGLELGLHIDWFNQDGKPSDFREGVPHLMREYLARDPNRPGCLIGGSYHDCGRVRNADRAARAVVYELSEWFKANGAPNVRAEFGGDLRFVKITDGTRVYSLI